MNILPVYLNFTITLCSGGLWVGGVCKPIYVSGHNHVMIVGDGCGFEQSNELNHEATLLFQRK